MHFCNILILGLEVLRNNRKDFFLKHLCTHEYTIRRYVKNQDVTVAKLLF